jgi:hypothetical protein
MRILGSIVETSADLVPTGRPDLIHRGRISPKPVGDDALRPTIFLHDPLEKLQRCSLVSSCGEEVQLSSRPGAQSFQSGAPSRHSPGLQTEALVCVGRVARPCGVGRPLPSGHVAPRAGDRCYSGKPPLTNSWRLFLVIAKSGFSSPRQHTGGRCSSTCLNAPCGPRLPA